LIEIVILFNNDALSSLSSLFSSSSVDYINNDNDDDDNDNDNDDAAAVQ